MKRFVFLLGLMCIISAVGHGQAGRTCSDPLKVTCNKYLHVDEMFKGELSDNGGMPCIDDFREVSGIWLELDITRAGLLSFDLVPDDPHEDLDFTLFQGGNCGSSYAIRCVAGGPIVHGAGSCTGATGLRSGEMDHFELPGCSIGQNNYAAPKEVQPGDHMLLFIHGFKGRGGFGLMFHDVLTAIPASVLEGVYTSEEDGAFILGYGHKELGPSPELVWTIDDGNDEHMLIGPGPHRMYTMHSAKARWKLEAVLGEDCINEFASSGSREWDKLDDKLIVWPNPVADKIMVDLRDLDSQEIRKIQVIDFQGQLQIEHRITRSVETIDVGLLVPGPYVIRLLPEGKYGLMVKI